MDKRVLLIINPIAGTSKKKGLDDFIVGQLLPLGWHVDVEHTTGPGDATSLAAQAVAEKYDAVIAAGGDGTINETARALCDTEVPLGIVPCGSGNGLARHLDIPIDAAESVGVISRANVRTIDYGRLNNLFFFCTCGVGFDADVSHNFAHKGSRGFSTYIKSAFETYQNFSPVEYSISIENEKITDEAFLIAVCNASQYGNNAYIAPKASIDDGLLDITLIHKGNALQSSLLAFDLLNGNISNNALVSSFRAPSVIIERSQGDAVHVDGEPIKLSGPMNIRCCPGGLKVFTPEQQPKVRPFITPAAAFARDLRLLIKHTFGID